MRISSFSRKEFKSLGDDFFHPRFASPRDSISFRLGIHMVESGRTRKKQLSNYLTCSRWAQATISLNSSYDLATRHALFFMLSCCLYFKSASSASLSSDSSFEDTMFPLESIMPLMSEDERTCTRGAMRSAAAMIVRREKGVSEVTAVGDG